MPDLEEELKKAVPRPAASASKARARHDDPLKPMLATYPRLPASSASRRSFGAVGSGMSLKDGPVFFISLPPENEGLKKDKNNTKTRAMISLGGGTGSDKNETKNKNPHIFIAPRLLLASRRIIVSSSQVSSKIARRNIDDRIDGCCSLHALYDTYIPALH